VAGPSCLPAKKLYYLLSVKKPVPHIRWFSRLLAGVTLATALFYAAGCGGGSIGNISHGTSAAAENAEIPLTAADVQNVITSAASAVDAGVDIAVTDRGGNILALYEKPGAPATSVGNFSQMVNTRELAVALARTASYFSNDQAPLSSRTVRYISGIHFPPGIANKQAADLYGIENTNRGCPFNTTYLPGKAINPSRSINGSTTGLGIITGKVDIFDSDPNAVNPGGVPLFKNGHLVGGVGVAGATFDITEFMAFSGAVGAGFGPTPAPPGVVIIDGVSLPFVNQTTMPAGANPGSANGAFLIGPVASAGPVPDGELIAVTAGTVGGLTVNDVNTIVNAAVTTANTERAVIRLPLGSRARFAIAVADLDGRLLALYRMPDATVFSVDVAVAKSRNMIYFSSPQVDPQDLPGVPPGTAVTNRTISFGAQPLFPSGINDSTPGPFFDLFQFDLANPCTNGHQPPNPNQNGVVFFPGSVTLYKNGVMVGGLGISGDGVSQDDFDAGQASVGFEAPPAIRADQIFIRGVRLPYLKYPRNPTQ